MIFVVDASVALRWLLSREPDPDAERVLERVLASPWSFAVPELFAFETFSVLSRHHPDPLKAWEQAIQPVLTTGVHRHPVTRDLLAAALPFVRRGLSGYDAVYAGLARQCRGLWLTYDKAAHQRIAGDRVSFLLGSGLPKEM
jgi:predicted nucleic acid-binding protein